MSTLNEIEYCGTCEKDTQHNELGCILCNDSAYAKEKNDFLKAQSEKTLETRLTNIEATIFDWMNRE